VVEALLAIGAVLLVITLGAAIECYRQIIRARREYEKAKYVLEDIVLSFNREFKRETEKLDIMAYKIEGNAAKADSSLRKAETIEKKSISFETQLNTMSKNESTKSTTLTEVNDKIRNLEKTEETIRAQVTTLNDQIQKLSALPEIKIEPVIPIKRDKAMASLTDTELNVLEMLSTEGAKTAPEIKERVQLSREHTARLMKKLYEQGYLERETSKIPFKYTVKKEMERFLKKPESTQG
jgi:DNA-binding CsgD family transcriptional regulator